MQLWGLAGAAAGLAAIATFADHRRSRRADLERVGFMPWTLITVMAVLAAVMFAALALTRG